MGAFVQHFCSLLAAAFLLVVTGYSPALAQVPAPPEIGEIDGNGVHLPTGDVIASRGGVSIGPSDHRGLSFSQQYVDTGWRYTQAPTISGSTSYPVVSFMGSSVSFVPDGSGGYKPAYENGATLNAARTLFTGPDGTKITFLQAPYIESFLPGDSGLGYPSVVTFTDGVIWSYAYQDDNWENARGDTFYFRRLSSIYTNTGYQIKLFYASDTTTSPVSGPWHRLASAVAINNVIDYCSASGYTCSFSQSWPTVSYGSTGTTMVDPAGDTTTYSYTSGRLWTVRPPAASADTVVYSYTGTQVTGVSVAGVGTTYSYGTGTTTVTPTGSAAATVTYGTSGASAGQTLTRTVAGQTSTFTYCAVNDAVCRFGLLRTATTPEGQATTYDYNVRGLVTQTTATPASGSGLATITTSATYPNPGTCTNPIYCNKPTSTTDATGQVTNYTYNTTHGGVTQVQLPAAAGGQPRPTVNVTYAAYTAKAKNWSGTLVNFPTSITMATGSTTCRTPIDGAAYPVMPGNSICGKGEGR